MINTMNTSPHPFGVMLSLAENWKELVIADWETTKYNSSLFMDLPTEAFPLFQGDYQQIGIFRKGLSHQMGLAGWEDITKSRASGTDSADDPGVSACDDYTPTILNDAGQEIWRNSMQQRLLASPAICVNDLRSQTAAVKQTQLRVNFYMEQIKEYALAYRREQYMKSVMRSNHGYLMNAANFEPSITATDNHFYYDMDHNDATLGVPCLYYKVGDEVGTLNIEVLEQQQLWLASQCPDAATGSMDGMPSFTAYGDMQDLSKMIRDDDAQREDVRYADPSYLIGSWRKMRTYRGITIAHDLAQMRFTDVGVVAADQASNKIHDGRGGYLATGNWVKCARVNPERNSSRTGLNGFQIVEANPNYFSAPLRLMPFFMTNVMTILIGQKLESIAGMDFGPQIGYNFETKFLVYPENEKNPFGEKGAWVSRANLGVQPMRNYLNTVAYLYRSCQQQVLSLCGTDGIATTAVALARNAESADLDATNYTVDVTLASAIKATMGDEVTVVAAISGSVKGYVLDATMAPTYTLGFTSTTFGSFLITEFTTATTVQVVVD